MQAKPIFDNVIVKRAAEEEASEGGIIIPDAAKEKPQQGTVMAAGDDCEAIKPGDIVLFSKYAGSEINLGEGEFLLISEDDIQVILGFDSEFNV